ncbi:hypothetical protein [Arachidicoccus ginsenosidimutans]|nr:hypothetical protein [Arachidicoccus sp. BS20]
MSSISDKYEAVSGVKIHAQLAIQSKLFYSDNTISHNLNKDWLLILK